MSQKVKGLKVSLVNLSEVRRSLEELLCGTVAAGLGKFV